MVRRVTPSQFKSLVRQHQQKLNREITKFNQAQRKAVNEYNAAVRKVNAERTRRRQAYLTAVAQYNRAVSAHNSRVRVDRARASRVVAQLQSGTATSYATVRVTTVEMVDRFERIQAEPVYSTEHADIIRLAQAEVDNSISVAETLFDFEPDQVDSTGDEPSGILGYLGDLSEDLLARWKGAMFAMNPVNPDAARHFCTSAREIFTDILEGWASDEDVLAANPNCQMTPNGSKPTRRAKIQYLLSLNPDQPENTARPAGPCPRRKRLRAAPPPCRLDFPIARFPPCPRREAVLHESGALRASPLQGRPNSQKRAPQGSPRTKESHKWQPIG